MTASWFSGNLVWRLAVAVALLVWLTMPAARAQDAQVSKESAACLKCHDKPALDMKLGDGKKLSLAVSAKAYLASAHKDQDCTDCHSALDEKDHGRPGYESALNSRRELTQSMQDSCTDCHKKKVKLYGDSIHATLARQGNQKAPLCADCHDAHTQPLGKAAMLALDKSPCMSCHEAVSKAYAMDIHGVGGAMKGKKTPICADCHFAHDVQAASLGEGLRDACMKCHQQTVVQHKQWLPNARLHFEANACAVCHAPGGARRVNLRLYDASNKTQLREKSGVPRFAQRARAGDVTSMGLDERALFSLLTEFSQDRGLPGSTVLRGRLELRDGLDAHRMVERAKAVSRCDSCHSSGAEPFQSVVVSIAGPDGRPLRHGVQKDVLSSMAALASVRGFYAIGSTRIESLDWLLAIAVGGSLAGVIGHMTARRIFRSVRERRAAAGGAARA